MVTEDQNDCQREWLTVSDEDYIRFLQDCDQEARTWLARSVPVALLVAGVGLILGLSWVFG